MGRTTFASALVLGVLAGPWSVSAVPGSGRAEPLDFAGTTLCGDASRAFLGGLDVGAPCHAITWRIRLEPSTDGRAGWSLTATYGVPPASNPNLMVDGPKVTLKGTWTVTKGAGRDVSASVYRLTSEARRTVAFVRISDDLVHMLGDDGRLMVGTGGWSYTLNRADRMEKPGQPATAPDMSYTISPRGSGNTVFGVFEGRTPCTGVARELKIEPVAGCLKVKWRVTLFQNPSTGQPATYKIEGTLHRQRAREGSWRIVRGTPDDPRAIVYELAATEREAALRLLQVDDRVLFFAGQDGNLLIGNVDFSYTLNRVGA